MVEGWFIVKLGGRDQFWTIREGDNAIFSLTNRESQPANRPILIEPLSLSLYAAHHVDTFSYSIVIWLACLFHLRHLYGPLGLDFWLELGS